MLKIATAHDAEARHLVELYDRRCTLAHEMARNPSPGRADAQAILDAGEELDLACETFRRKHYPRRARCFVGLWTVIVASATLRKVETVLDLSGEFGGA